jgi:hypothetical protein
MYPLGIYHSRTVWRSSSTSDTPVRPDASKTQASVSSSNIKAHFPKSPVKRKKRFAEADSKSGLIVVSTEVGHYFPVTVPYSVRLDIVKERSARQGEAS